MTEPHRFFLSHLRHEPEELRAFFAELAPSAKVLLTYARELPECYRRLEAQFECVELVNLFAFRERKFALDVWKKIESILESIFTDPSTPLIWERGKTSAKGGLLDLAIGRKQSFLKGSAEIANEVIFFHQFFEATKPTFLLFGFTPHSITSWIRMKVAQQMGIPTLVINRCGVDGFYRIAERYERNEKNLQIGSVNDKEAAIHEERLNLIVKNTLSSYTEAQPDYERIRFEQSRGDYVRLSHIVRQHWYAPGRAINTFRCWRQLERSSRSLNDIKNCKYAIFFLHYQPEATSVPNGDLFGSQLNAILALRSTLPKDVKLLVKEHPATFMIACHGIARDPEFYARISSLPNVEFIDIQTDNFELIDSSILTATISGTVGREALIRGAPTVFFGKSFLDSSQGCFNYQESSGFRDFIQTVANGGFSRKHISEQAIAAMDSQRSNAFFSRTSSENELMLDGLRTIMHRGVSFDR